MVYVAVPLPVPGCQRLSGILQFIFVREYLPIVIFYLYSCLYFQFKVTHLGIVVSDLCKYLSEFVLSCKSEFIGLCMYLFLCVFFIYTSFQRKFCKSKLLKKKEKFVFRFYHHQQSFCQSGSVWRPKAAMAQK